MIVALWHRWFDSREHRSARERAEASYSQALVREMELRGENIKLRRANARLAVSVDARAEDRIEVLDERAVNAEKALAEAKQRIRDLERQLDEVAAVKVTAHRIVDQHAQATALPPALTRDRENALRLTDEIERLRVLVETCEKEHR